MGWTGSILSRELTKAGLHVVGLERGAMRTPREDFTIPSIRDELKYSSRHELFQDTALETVTLRHDTRETALPIRRLGSFLPGMNVGGAGSHWNGATWRRPKTARAHGWTPATDKERMTSSAWRQRQVAPCQDRKIT